jgi:hypothetical protein
MEFIVWFLGIPAGLLVIFAITSGLEWFAWRASLAADDYAARFTTWKDAARYQRAQMQDHKHFLRWLRERLGNGDLGSRADEHLVEAQRQAEMIRPLIEDEIPKAVMQCVETHRLLSQASGAFSMSEIAYEPECQHSRLTVTWILSHAVRLLDNYPLRFEDRRLLHNAVVLRKRALPTCRRCPYIQLQVDVAPQLCPTAELVQIRREPHVGTC